MRPGIPLTRRLAANLAICALLVSCTSPASSPDQRLCAEVERVVGTLVEQEVPIDETEDLHILASHLVVATTGDPEGKPSPDLAEVIHAAGMQGTSSQPPEFLGGLVDSYDACEDAGISMDRGPLEELAER